jgi:hypothetical protein
MAEIEMMGPVDPTQFAAADAASVDPAMVTQEDPAAAQAQEEADNALISEIYNKFDLYRRIRRPYEIQWYINTSAFRGYPDVRWNSEEDRLEIKKEPAHRTRYRINYIKSKVIARVAKYTRTPPNPSVIPATSDREDIFNARASQKALEYITKKAAIRQRFMQTQESTPLTGKAFLAIRWDDKVAGAAPSKNVISGEIAPTMGEVRVDFVSAFELLIPDPGLENLGDQPDVIRAKLVPLKMLKDRFPTEAADLSGESKDADIFLYQRQIADLGSRQGGTASGASSYGEGEEEEKKYILRLEYFVKPCEDYPQGRYVVVAGRTKLHEVPNLPGSFMQINEQNPYPFVEFVDDKAPGQFYPDAFVERMIDLQREYNEYRSKVAESLKVNMFPKLLVWNQLGIDETAFNSEGGERLNANYIPGIPPPSYINPPNVAADAWNAIAIIKKEFDDITMIHPASMGGGTGQSSGFQTSLLQEAADQVHGPAIQRNAYALEEMYMKVRHLMKIFYTIPRMISVAGRNNIPEVLEFSAESIDENSNIVIEPDTMMPPLRSQRLDQIRQWAAEGLYGNIQDPSVLKKIQDAARMHGYTDPYADQLHRDEEEAQEENIRMNRGEELQKPQPWENHMTHWAEHVDEFKSPEAKQWPPDQMQRNVLHALVHLNYINPQQALMMAGEFGLQGPLIQIQQLQQMQAMQGFQMGTGPQAAQDPNQAPPGGPNGPQNGPSNGPPDPSQGNQPPAGPPPEQAQTPPSGPPPF